MNRAEAFQTPAHQLLEELELRHDKLLAELASLDARVDSVLLQYTNVRPVPVDDRVMSKIDLDAHSEED